MWDSRFTPLDDLKDNSVAVLLRIERSWVKQQNTQKAGQDRILTLKFPAFARPTHDRLLAPEV